MDVVLRTLLRELELRTTYAPGERWHNRGVAFAPAKGGRAVVHRRTAPRRVTVDLRDAGAEAPGGRR
jgi:hypothetical protein